MSRSFPLAESGTDVPNNDLLFENLLEIDAQMALLIKSITTHHNCERILTKSVTLLTKALIQFTKQSKPTLKSSATLIALMSSGAVINILNAMRAQNHSIKLINACLEMLNAMLHFDDSTTRDLSHLLISSGMKFHIM